MKLENIFSALQNEPRLLIETELKPVQGSRFQPTGFPDLGAATFSRPNSNGTFTSMLLVESAQSMANRLEEVCWDRANDKIDEKLTGLSHVFVNLDNGQTTNTLIEAHRLNSTYIMESNKDLITRFEQFKEGRFDVKKFAKTTFETDAGSILHGVFLESIAGRIRLQRLLSAFIEAEDLNTVASGGVKIDILAPKNEESEDGKRASQLGRGNVIYPRTEFTAKRIVTFFNLDLATMRGYGLGENAEKLLIALSLFKILRFLKTGLRLRTACDFDLLNFTVTRPKNLVFNDIDTLLAETEQILPNLIQACNFGEQPLKLQGKMK